MARTQTWAKFHLARGGLPLRQQQRRHYHQGSACLRQGCRFIQDRRRDRGRPLLLGLVDG
eukprot:9939833-Alexandrium_andersonii.AAC.1